MKDNVLFPLASLINIYSGNQQFEMLFCFQLHNSILVVYSNISELPSNLGKHL